MHTDLSYAKGIHNIKIGANYSQTFLRESDTLGVVEPRSTHLASISANPVNGFTDPSQCAAAGLFPNDAVLAGRRYDFNPVLLPFDLTRGGGQFNFIGHTDVKELALYAAGPDQSRKLAVQPWHPRRSL